MNIYFAHPVTREYLGHAVADPNPLVEGEWLIPASAYPDAPPSVPAGKAAQRSDDGRAWLMVADHRGPVYSTASGAPQQHAELGELPGGLTTLARPSLFHSWAGDGWVLNEAAKAEADRALERAWRDGELNQWFGLRDRHRDEVDMAITTTLKAEQFAALLVYIQQLRAWPQSEHFPVVEYRPAPPGWLAAG